MAAKKLTFEEAMKRLEEIVSLLENGEADLESSLKLFAEGSALRGRMPRQAGQREADGGKAVSRRKKPIARTCNDGF
jgi:exodeoxyribonuclease VII small subunit